jgi:hypothetical protein
MSGRGAYLQYRLYGLGGTSASPSYTNIQGARHAVPVVFSHEGGYES